MTNKISTFNQYIFRRISDFINKNYGSILRTIIYTIGHFFIAATCVWYFTGASFAAAITDAIVEPLINGVWYYVLDRFWASKFNKPKTSKYKYIIKS